jgi:hypothetical protein
MIAAAVRESDEEVKTASISDGTVGESPETSTHETSKVAAVDALALADQLEKVGEALSGSESMERVLSKLGGRGKSLLVPGSETNMADMKGKMTQKSNRSKTAPPPMVPSMESGTVKGPATAMETNMNQDGSTIHTVQKDSLMKAAKARKEKMASLKQKLLNKLAGEDVASASISGAKSASHPEDEAAPSQPQGSERRLIGSNDSAIRYTKGQAKGVQKKVMRDVLDEPALKRSTDSKLHDNLQNTARAGVKISEVRQQFKKVASEGCSCAQEGTCGYCQLAERVKGVREKRAAAHGARSRIKAALSKKGFFDLGSQSMGASTGSMPAAS